MACLARCKIYRAACIQKLQQVAVVPSGGSGGNEAVNLPKQVMELVKALTRTMNSITVCATIHSPSPQTFDLFDKVMILLSGRIVYFGSNGDRPLQAIILQALPKPPISGLHDHSEAAWASHALSSWKASVW